MPVWSGAQGQGQWSGLGGTHHASGRMDREVLPLPPAWSCSHTELLHFARFPGWPGHLHCLASVHAYTLASRLSSPQPAPARPANFHT